MKTLYLSISLVVLFSILLTAQDGLHLVGTITGTSEVSRVYSARGIGDFNGDGYKDFIVTYLGKDTTIFNDTYFTYYTNLYFGSSDFDTIPDFTFKQSFGYSIGDVNNDGYDDLMVNYVDYTYYPPYSTFKIFQGGKNLDTIPIFTYTPPYKWNMLFSEDIEDIGDLNGDGYRDFIIASPYNWSDGRGSVFVFHGGDTLPSQPSQILKAKILITGGLFGYSVTGINDINRDGYDDILICQKVYDLDSNNVQLFYGGETLDSIPDRILMQNDDNFGVNVKNAGDINGDGNTDFIITGKYTFIYLSLNDIMFINPQLWGIGGFNSIGCGGDINDDGYDDFILGNTNVTDSLGVMTGAVFGYWGGRDIDSISDYILMGNKKWSYFGRIIDIVGDINKDRYDDVLILEPGNTSNVNALGKVFIYSYKTLSSVKEYSKPNKAEIFHLNQNYPNPFNPTTTINYDLSVTSNITIKIFDALGKEIVLIDNGIKTPGEYKFTLNSDKYKLSSGTYFIEFTLQLLNGRANIYHKVIKAVLLK